MSTALKVKTITFSFPAPMDVGISGYKVEKVTDSIEYNPGQTLAPDEVARLCDSKRWKVTVIRA